MHGGEGTAEVAGPDRASRAVAQERDLVFNIVWTGTVFTYLRCFVASQIAQSTARFRFVANGCPPEQVDAMERFAAAHDGRVVEVLPVSADKMLRHGDALDIVLHSRDDGDHFCLIDADILARGPFLADFAAALAEPVAAVTSGRGVWNDSVVVPPGHRGLNGEYFFSADGYVYGSPHFALYRREPLLETTERWEVGFGTGGGPRLAERARQRLADGGHDFLLFDTGKIVNILLQEDGHVVRHFEHPNLMHIGGISHYLSPPRFVDRGDGPEPDWVRWDGMEARFEVARFTAAVLRALLERRPAPPVPGDLEPSMDARLRHVRATLVDLVATYDDN